MQKFGKSDGKLDVVIITTTTNRGVGSNFEVVQPDL